LIMRVFGPRLTRHPDGYRLMFTLRDVRDIIGELAPDVLETGDPWISGPLGLWLKHRGWFDGLLSSFYHSDPIGTYLEPWISKRRWGRRVRRSLVGAATKKFFRLQRAYDLTFAASDAMRRRLRAHHVPNVVGAPMGVDPVFFAAGASRPGGRHARILYAGRLDADKEVGLLESAVHRLLAQPEVSVT